MKSRNILIMGIQETHICDSKSFYEEGYLVILSGATDASTYPFYAGVGFILSPEAISAVIGYELIDDRFVSLRMKIDGTPHPYADTRPGSSLARAERSKAVTYPELVNSSQLRLETVACEIGGRLSLNAQRILDVVAVSKARSELESRQKYMTKWWRNRWISMLAVAIQSCVSSILVDDGCLLDGFDGPTLGMKDRESREPALERTCEFGETNEGTASDGIAVGPTRYEGIASDGIATGSEASASVRARVVEELARALMSE